MWLASPTTWFTFSLISTNTSDGHGFSYNGVTRSLIPIEFNHWQSCLYQVMHVAIYKSCWKRENWEHPCELWRIHIWSSLPSCVAAIQVPLDNWDQPSWPVLWSLSLLVGSIALSSPDDQGTISYFNSSHPWGCSLLAAFLSWAPCTLSLSLEVRVVSESTNYPHGLFGITVRGSSQFYSFVHKLLIMGEKASLIGHRQSTDWIQQGAPALQGVASSWPTTGPP